MDLAFRSIILLVVALVAGVSPVVLADETPATQEAKQLAFPGAEGFGRFARGGRGGDVYHVINLKDEGPGSLREGIRTATGPRTIVFDVSGTILLKTTLTIDKSHITLAGQTAPGDGICLRDQTFRIKLASHVIVRYLRFRLGDENKPRPSAPDCVNTDDVDHVIFDHVTASWGIDGNHDLRRGGNFTLQWSIYAEALNHSLHDDGSHAMLASFRDLTASISLHHNLFASSRERHPTLGGSPRTNPQAVADFRNNVIYNLTGATNFGNCRINAIGNWYRPGPNTSRDGQPLAIKTENVGALKVFLAGNVFEDHPNWTEHNAQAINFARWTTGNYLATTAEQVLVDQSFEIGDNAPRTDDAARAYERVLQSAGASLRRDAADARLVSGVRDRTNRLIDSQRQVGGWPLLASDLPPLDTDQDGMPDAWETQSGLNPKNPDDRNADRNGDGYTNLEEYLNSLAPVPGDVPGEAPAQAQPPSPPTTSSQAGFKKLVLSSHYYCDGIASADINRDGHTDVVAGPYWYAGPEFTSAHAFYPAVPLAPETSPSDSMFSFVHDFSGDGWPDILVLGRVHLHPAYWYENPGAKNPDNKPWAKHYAFERVQGESPTLVDLDGDGHPQLICHWQGRWGWIEPRWEKPTEPWQFHPISDPGEWKEFYHGTGVGDLNNDRRLDLVINDGWFLQPNPKAPLWNWTPHKFSQGKGGAQMLVDDVDGDGDADVITALDSHGWGLAWFEQHEVNGQRAFRPHTIMGTRDELPQHGVAFTQPHALALGDINGDGLKDIVTGKRMWAHGPSGDIEPTASPVLYWFELARSKQGLRYIPHLIDTRSGVGVQVSVADVNTDGRQDILTASKLGTFVFLNER